MSFWNLDSKEYKRCTSEIIRLDAEIAKLQTKLQQLEAMHMKLAGKYYAHLSEERKAEAPPEATEEDQAQKDLKGFTGRYL